MTYHWTSIILYCVFGVFLFFQRRHLQSFRGSSAGVSAALYTYTGAGLIAGLAYLVYYSMGTVWWAFAPVFIIGFVVTMGAAMIIPRGMDLAVSMAGFIALPLAGIAMFMTL